MPAFADCRTSSRIVHEMPRRMRIRCAVFHDPDFDPVYVEAMLQNISGVECVRFNLKAAAVVVEYNGEAACRQKILDCLGSIPEEACQLSGRKVEEPDEVGAAVKGVLALLTPAIPRPLRSVLGYWMALPILLKGFGTLLNRGVKVEVLDAAVVGFSLARRDYFTANSIVALLALGEYLEQLSEEKTTGLLKNLLRPQVEYVWVERDGQEIQTSLSEVLIGDFVVCGPGELIPVDGLVAEGEALLNQSSITGESLPVHVRPGDEVVSSAVVQEGHVKVEARQVGSDTSMARINRFLENSLRNKSESQKKSDELADSLVPTTFGLGMGLYLLTRDVRRAAAVLSVDYSCAIKLANPVAVKTAMYTAAHSGVLLKGAEALDALAKVDAVVFDKTGTLTRGALEVTDILPQDGLPADELLALAAAAEEHYAHPVARAVVMEAGRHGLPLPPTGRVDFIVAHGVSAYVNGNRVLVGSHHFIGEDENIDCSSMDAQALDLRRQGKSLLYVARDERLLGLIALRDALRPEAAEALRQLKKYNIKKIVTLTGDHPETARAVAGQLDALDEIHWDLKPEDKAAIVKSLKEAGHVVAFAGDGVNDAPALVTADVGVCMSGGSDLARESAQVVLLEDDLNALVMARRIAVQTEKTINNCFRSTVGFNTLLLVLAGAGYIRPLAAAVLHNANTVGILGYAALAGMHKPGDGKDADV